MNEVAQVSSAWCRLCALGHLFGLGLASSSSSLGCYVGYEGPLAEREDGPVELRLRHLRRYDPDGFEPLGGHFERSARADFRLPERIAASRGNAGEGRLTLYFLPGNAPDVNCDYLGDPDDGDFHFDACFSSLELDQSEPPPLDAVPGDTVTAESVGLFVHEASPQAGVTVASVNLTGTVLVREPEMRSRHRAE